MSKWDQFKKKDEESSDTTPHLTMNLRCVVGRNGQTIEQLVEYRNKNSMVVSTEWVEIPTIYQQK